MDNIKLTTMEARVMGCFLTDDYAEEGVDSIIWTDCFLDHVKFMTEIDAKQTRGILSSLIQKDMIFVEESMGLTENGKQYLRNK